MGTTFYECIHRLFTFFWFFQGQDEDSGEVETESNDFFATFETLEVEGLQSCWGHESCTDYIAPRDSELVRRLKAAGAVIVGKTNVPVDLSDWQSFNPVYGRTKNPHNADRSPGGSSGGSAAAVAAGMVAGEYGTDIGGSVRVPGHFCGAWAHKSTWGIVSKQGHSHPQMARRKGFVAAHDGALSIAGPTSTFTPTFFTFVGVPFLMLAGDIDALVPYQSNAAPVPDVVPGGELVTITAASHTGFADPAGSLRWMSNPDAIGCYMVKDNVDQDVAEPWFELIGTPEQGINYSAENELCLMDPLPKAMNALRQHMITKVVVGSFFQAHFAAEESERAAAQNYLSETLSRELDDADYTAPRG